MIVLVFALYHPLNAGHGARRSHLVVRILDDPRLGTQRRVISVQGPQQLGSNMALKAAKNSLVDRILVCSGVLLTSFILLVP